MCYPGQTEKSANANKGEGKWCWNQSETADGERERERNAITRRADGNNVGQELKKSSVKLRVVSFKIPLIDRGNFKAWQRFCGSCIRKHSRVFFKEKMHLHTIEPSLLSSLQQTGISASRLAALGTRA